MVRSVTQLLPSLSCCIGRFMEERMFWRSPNCSCRGLEREEAGKEETIGGGRRRGNISRQKTSTEEGKEKEEDEREGKGGKVV